MRTFILAATVIGFSTAGALAQTTGIAHRDSTKIETQGGTSSNLKKDGMSRTTGVSGTTGMAHMTGRSSTSGISDEAMKMYDHSKDNDPVAVSRRPALLR